MKKHFLLLILSLLFLPLAQGKVKLPAMMGDHMVLQQNSSVTICDRIFRGSAPLADAGKLSNFILKPLRLLVKK